jgi:amino acid transporter
LALLGALNYPAGVLFAQIITMLIIRDFLEILMYSEVRGVYYLARYYLPFYSVIILIFYLWVSISQELSKRLPIQAIVVATVGIALIYIYAVRSLRRLD